MSDLVLLKYLCFFFFFLVRSLEFSFVFSPEVIWFFIAVVSLCWLVDLLSSSVLLLCSCA